MTREERLNKLIDGLKKESPEYAPILIPASLSKKQKLLRTMMNVRPPEPIDSYWKQLQEMVPYIQLKDILE